MCGGFCFFPVKNTGPNVLCRINSGHLTGQPVRWYNLLHFMYLINVINYGYKRHRKEELIELCNFLKNIILLLLLIFFFFF